MKRNLLNKILCCTASMGLCVMMALGGVSARAVAEEVTPDYAAKSDDYYSYVQKFEDINAVNNAFNGYYRENALGSAKSEVVSTSATDPDTHWYIENGVLSRINGVGPDEDTGSYETNRVAILTFTKDAYLNFELSIDYKAGSQGFWPVIGIRQLEEGKYHLDDGAGVFVQKNGLITLWGDPAVSGPYEFATAQNYDSTQWHNMQIRVLGNTLFVSIDNQPWVTQALSDAFYEAGYVSLISVNNMCHYRNFRIKALSEPEKTENGVFLPETEADSDDALSKLAGGVQEGELFEREGKVNPDLVYTEWQNVVVGCSATMGMGAFSVILPGAILLALKKKREN